MAGRGRRDEIMEILGKRGYISVEELAKQLYVSVSTVRRDLGILKKEGSVHWARGSVSYVSPEFTLEPLNYRHQMYRKEKRTIARLASTLIRDGDTIFLDSGSTCMQIAYELKGIPGLTILTNGTLVIQALSRVDGIHVEVPCGLLDMKHACIVGTDTTEFIAKRYADISFISCSAMDVEHGITAIYRGDKDVKQAFSRHSARTVLLMDHSKVGKALYYKICDYSDIDVVICDSPLPEDISAVCRERGVEVITE